MATVLRWTGREARVLREAMRMSVRGFASYLGCNDAAVSNWERRGEKAKLRTQTQRDLDTALKRADDDARHRFTSALAASAPGAGTEEQPLAVLGMPTNLCGLTGWTPTEQATLSAAAAGLVGQAPAPVCGAQRCGWDRAAVLRAMVGVASLPLIAPSPRTSSEATGHQPPLVDPSSYAQVTCCYQQLYWAGSGLPLLHAAYGHTRLGLELIRQAPAGQQTAMAAALAQSALLTARLALFDLSMPTLAADSLGVALAAARSAEDPTLCAVVTGHLAFAFAFAHQPGHAGQLVDQALHHAGHGVPAQVTSWVHCVASEVHARAGAATTSSRHIDQAHATFTTDSPPPVWFDFYDQARLDAFAGYAALTIGDHTQAVTHLTRALDSLGPAGGKQRSVVLADLAGAHATDGDQIADYLNQAIDALQPTPYTTGLDRIRAVLPLLGDSSHGKHIDQRVAALTAHQLPAGG